MADLDAVTLVAILAALALGGLVKGATGAGTPIVAVPVMAAFYDVRLAVVVMVVPNLVSNFWQMRRFRRARLPRDFARTFAIGGAVGAALGTGLLAVLPEAALALLIAGAVALYVLLRLVRPDLRLAFATARAMVLPVGTAAGVLQGAAGISGPISVSFLSAMRLERPVFIATVSAFFVAMSAVQLLALVAVGLMTPGRLALSVVAILPVLAAMPLGNWVGGRLSARVFDRIILTLLTVMSARLAWSALG